MVKLDINELPYRKGVNAFVIDASENLLIIQKQIYGEHQWEVPGGGVDDNENVEEALLRELEEELGSKSFKILAMSSQRYIYEWSMDAIEDCYNKKGKTYRGSEKFQYLVLFIGKKGDICFQESEIKKLKWVPYSELEAHFVFDGQWDFAKKVLEEFKNLGYIKLNA